MDLPLNVWQAWTFRSPSAFPPLSQSSWGNPRKSQGNWHSCYRLLSIQLEAEVATHQRRPWASDPWENLLRQEEERTSDIRFFEADSNLSLWVFNI